MRCKGITPDRLILVAFVVCILQCNADSSPVHAQNWSAVEKKELYEKRHGYTGMNGSLLRKLAADNAAFGMDLYAQISKSPGNIFFSPYSISEAFAMLYAGAKGETAAELERTLHITIDKDSLHTAYRDLLTLLDYYVTFSNDAVQGCTLDIANGLWVQNGFPLRTEYVTTLRDFHRSEPASLDFAGAPEQSRATINNWISDRTKGMIKDIVTPGSLNASTKLVLVNTIYFEAKWSGPFLSRDTKEGEFHRLDSTTITVPMMHQHSIGGRGYAEDSDWQAAELPYINGGLAMLIILPRPGKFAEVERILNAEFLVSLDDSLRYDILLLTIPKFKITSPSLNLKDALTTLGLKTVFTGKADFSGSSTSQLFLDKAIHKAMVSVDEEGTIAAGATVLPRMAGTPGANPIEFTADRPFFFLIRDLKSRSVLFMGRVVDPS
jgi:serpin B